MQSLEFWAGGDFRSSNIGPAAGDHFLGRFEGPGVYLLVGHNTAGKSHHLRLLSRAQDERLFRGAASVTDGADAARFEVGPLKVAFRRDGEPDRTGAERLPRVESMPHPISTLITADNLKGVEERMRRRLQALLTYIPVPSSDELRGVLLRTAANRAFTERSQEHVAAWWRLACDARTARAKIRIHEHMRIEQLRSWLFALPQGALLEDHSSLVDQLNLLGNTGEYAAGVQHRVVERIKGQLAGAAEAAWRTAGGVGPPSDEFVAELAAGHDVAALREEVRSLDEHLAVVRAERAARLHQEAERAELREGHGERPRTDAQEAALAESKRQLLDASVRRGDAARAEDENARTLDEVRPVASREFAQALAAWSRARQAVAELDRSLGDDGGSLGIAEALTIPEARIFDPALERSISALNGLGEKVSAARGSQRALGRAEQDLEASRRARIEAQEQERRATENLREAQAALDEASERVERWEDVAAKLDREPRGPSAEEVDQAEAESAGAKRRLELAIAAVEHQRLAALLEESRALHNAIESDAADYRRAAKESWKHLGDALTSALGIPWLSLSGTDILLHYSTSTGRLRTSVFEPSTARNIDDEERISSGELSEAMLRLMLEKRDSASGIIILPWEVVASLDEDRLHDFDRLVAEAGIYVVSERPRRSGDRNEMFLERVAER